MGRQVGTAHHNRRQSIPGGWTASCTGPSAAAADAEAAGKQAATAAGAARACAHAGVGREHSLVQNAGPPGRPVADHLHTCRRGRELCGRQQDGHSPGSPLAKHPCCQGAQPGVDYVVAAPGLPISPRRQLLLPPRRAHLASCFPPSPSGTCCTAAQAARLQHHQQQEKTVGTRGGSTGWV
jgi:hypothetical protein